MRGLLVGIVVAWMLSAVAQTPRTKFDAFEVATVKPVDADAKAGRTFKMDGTHRWVATNFTLEALLALAYDLNPRAISGGPGWMDEQKFSIETVTPGDVAPTRMEQMQMLRALLVERFALKFHRQGKEMSIYALRWRRAGRSCSRRPSRTTSQRLWAWCSRTT
jgi:uncharacterized protein (TIGR03435 family)